MTARTFHRLNPTRDGQAFGHSQPGSFCHCGRIVYRGVLPVARWPRLESQHRERFVG